MNFTTCTKNAVSLLAIDLTPLVKVLSSTSKKMKAIADDLDNSCPGTSVFTLACLGQVSDIHDSLYNITLCPTYKDYNSWNTKSYLIIRDRMTLLVPISCKENLFYRFFLPCRRWKCFDTDALAMETKKTLNIWLNS